MSMKKISLFVAAALIAGGAAQAQDQVRYTGKTIPNIDYHDGALPHIMGVHNIQTMRANRENPQYADGYGWTYNHGANIAYWNDTFWINYLSDPHGEHYPPGQTLVQSSTDGYNWTFPNVAFPIYKVPDGITHEGYGTSKNLYSVMHQRMGWYVSKKSNRLFTLGYYGISITHKDSPNQGEGIGRVIREVYKDGSMGPIYFIRYSPGFNEKNTDYPFYKTSKDKGFVEACDELLADPLMVQQWAEENRGDEILPLQRPLQAFCYYPLADGRLVAMWKNWLTSFSSDGGKSWGEVYAAPGFFTGTAKEWGQRLSDGTYAVVYNPSKFRWPMAICLSKDGLNYDNMYSVHGDISPMRYTGNEKSYGPQYLRGIMPGNGVVPDNNMWLAYSVNKEDIWAMRVTVPVQTVATAPINEDLSKYNKVSDLARWNVYSPVWAPVTVEKAPNGQNALKLADQDPYDYAKVEHLFPDSKKFTVEFSVMPAQNDKGLLHIELQNEAGLPAIRLLFEDDGVIRAKRGAKFNDLGKYTAGQKCDFKLEVDATTMTYRLTVNGGRPSNQAFYAPMNSFSRIVFRTGDTNKIPTPDNLAYEDYVLDKGSVPVPEANFYILSLKTTH